MAKKPASEKEQVEASARAMIRPTGVISNIPNAGCPAFRAISLTNRLVDVPIRVHAPPRMVTYDRGIRNRLGDRSSDCATSLTTGAASTTIGVLFRKAEAAPATPITIQSPKAPRRAHSRIARRMIEPRRPDSSML
jgi:hypothetical protein